MKKQDLINEINALPEGKSKRTSKIKASTLKHILKETVNQKKTAYDLWLEEGNTGTMSDFLSSLPESEVREKEASKSGGLVVNGSGHLKSNYNFSFATYDPLIVDQGMGSFRLPPVFRSYFSDFLIPVDPKKVYKFTASMTTNQDGFDAQRRIYLGLAPCDHDGQVMAADTHMYIGRFKLIQPYVIGVDKFMYVDNVTNIDQLTGSTGHPSHKLRMYVWNYRSDNGKDYKYYTRNRIFQFLEDGTQAIPIAGGFKIPVKTEGIQIVGELQYGKTLDAGTELSVGSSGGNYKYIGSYHETLPLYPSWKRCESYIGGIDYSGCNKNHNFPPGTAYVRVLVIPYSMTGGDNPIQWISDINLVEVDNVRQQRVNYGTLNKPYSQLKMVGINQTTNEPTSIDDLTRFITYSEEE